MYRVWEQTSPPPCEDGMFLDGTYLSPLMAAAAHLSSSHSPRYVVGDNGQRWRIEHARVGARGVPGVTLHLQECR